ncbi:hypothetical protein FDA77_18745 [Clostridium botulinum]|nr:hypothetical protein [Clostridium botulinum]NFJ91868.1 hypothetical protein [Clostridium botulinum]NFR74405.1 hypothetical protein [Clostridium botulinum]
MRVFASKSYLFKQEEEVALINNQEIKDMPDWIENTLLFKLAESDGSIQIIENNIQQKSVENGKTKNSKSKTKPTEDINEESPSDDK